MPFRFFLGFCISSLLLGTGAFAFEPALIWEQRIEISERARIDQVILSRNEKYVAAVHSAAIVEVFDAETGARIARFERPGVHAVLFDETGSRLLISTVTNTYRAEFVSIADGRTLWASDGWYFFRDGGFMEPYEFYTLGPFGRRFLGVSYVNASFVVVDFETGRLLSRGVLPKDGHSDLAHMNFSQDGRELLAPLLAEGSSTSRFSQPFPDQASTFDALTGEFSGTIEINETTKAAIFRDNEIGRNAATANLWANFASELYRDNSPHVTFRARNYAVGTKPHNAFVYGWRGEYGIVGADGNTYEGQDDALGFVHSTAWSRNGFEFISGGEDGSGGGWLRRWQMPTSDWSVSAVDIALAERWRAATSALERGDFPKVETEATVELLVHPYYGPSVFRLAAAKGTAALVEHLVSNGADVESIDPVTGWNALMAAAETGNSDTIDILLAFGADTSVLGTDGRTFLSLLMRSDVSPNDASQSGQVKRLLIEQFFSQNTEDALRSVARSGDRLMVATLLSLGTDANAQDEEGRTALMHAAGSGTDDSAQIILDLIGLGEADPDIRADNGATALSLAIAGGAPADVLSPLVAYTDLESAASRGSSYSALATALGNTVAQNLLPQEGWLPPKIDFPDLPDVEVPLARDMSRDQIRAAQRALLSKGLYSGSIDGLWGPASRRGLAAYFKVTLDESHSAIFAFCSDVADDFNRRNSGGVPLEGEAFIDDLAWEYDFTHSERPIARLEDRDTKERIRCGLGKETAGYQPRYASYFDGNERVKLDFIRKCSSNENWVRAEFRVDNEGVVFDFACKNALAGVPMVSENKSTRWQRY